MSLSLTSFYVQYYRILLCVSCKLVCLVILRFIGRTGRMYELQQVEHYCYCCYCYCYCCVSVRALQHLYSSSSLQISISGYLLVKCDNFQNYLINWESPSALLETCSNNFLILHILRAKGEGRRTNGDKLFDVLFCRDGK